MKVLLHASKEEQMPIEIMYMSDKGEITHRRVIVREIQNDFIRAFCFKRQQQRSFKKANILSAAKIRTRKGVNYA
ncbi:hypothetical protein [Metabacillus fastidiosus]|uniref:hypothetical protein n=1 Tax=Metabacillus fastidiosus TaxID=1458 RepID=UPI003D2711E4